MPKLTQTMDEGKLLDWLKKEGEPVEKGDLVATVETDKATVELESPASGVLARLVAAPGDSVPVGQPIAYIAAPGEALPEAAQPAAAPTAPPVPSAPAAAMPPSEPQILPFAREEAAPSSPRARRLARELGIDLATVQGTGPGGRIVEEDVQRAAEAAKAPPAPAAAEVAEAPAAAPAPVAPEAAAPVPPAPAGEVELVPLTGMRRTIAERMAASAHTTAPVTLTIEVDMTDAGALRQQLIASIEKESSAGEAVDHYTRRLREQLIASRERQAPRPSYTDMLVKAVAKTLAEFPRVNSRWTEQGIEIVKDINVGVAVALGETGDDGLVVPVIRNADRLSLIEIAQRTSAIAERARQRRLTQDEFSGGTFTITNLGMFGIGAFTPIINPPEAAILGVGQIAPRPMVCDTVVVVRSMVTLSLTIDHRIVDGAAGAVFLRRLRDILQNPMQLLL